MTRRADIASARTARRATAHPARVPQLAVGRQVVQPRENLMTEAAIPAASDLLNSRVPAPTPPPAPAWQPAGLPVAPPAFHAPEAVAARAEIESLKSDKEFYAT